ncbi:MAG: trigger factor [Candidatus Campbellbacteria bacterium]|nr:trigger factor [Candidatus Campbellbacteria bacterium]
MDTSEWNIEVVRKDTSAKVSGTIPQKEIESNFDGFLQNAKKTVEISGFRVGKAPDDKVVEHFGGEMQVISRVAESIIKKTYIDILKKEKLDVIGEPRVVFKKMAKGIDIPFEIEMIIIPNFELPDYKAISRQQIPEDPPKVEKKEIEDFVSQLKKDDQTNEEDLRKHAEEAIMKGKTEMAKQRRRVRIAKAIVGAVSLEVPEILINSKLEIMISRIKEDTEKMGMTFEDYLKKENITKEELREKWKGEAKERIIMELIIEKIARKENIKPDEKEIEEHLAKVKKHYKDADEKQLRPYIEAVLRNEKVFNFLEELIPTTI